MARKTTRKAAKRGTEAAGRSKSQLIREMYRQLGKEARPKEVIAALKEKGTEVSQALVTNVRARMGMRRKARKAGIAGGAISLQSLVAAKKLTEQAGGIAAAKAALDAFAKLL